MKRLFAISLFLVWLWPALSAENKIEYVPQQYNGNKDFFAAVYGAFLPDNLPVDQQYYPAKINIFNNTYDSPVEYYKIKDVLYKLQTEISFQNGQINTKIIQFSVFGGKGTIGMGALLLSGGVPESANSDWCKVPEKISIEEANAINKTLIDILNSDDQYAHFRDKALSDLKYISLIVENMNDVAFQDFCEVYLKNRNIPIDGSMDNLNLNKDSTTSQKYKYVASINAGFWIEPAKFNLIFTPSYFPISVQYLANDNKLIAMQKGDKAAFSGRLLSIERSSDNLSLTMIMADPNQ